MKQFDFDPYKCAINIRLATEYQPKILKNKITSRPYNGILYIIDGAYRYTFANGETRMVNAGDLLFLPADFAPYSYEIFTEGTTPRTAQVEFEVRTANSSAQTAKEPIICNCIKKTEAEDAIRTIITAFTSSRPDARFLTLAGLYRLFSVFETESDECTGSAAAIQPAVAYLEENYAVPTDSEYLASLCHLSTSQLRRKFNEVYGMPPLQYKRALIFKVAKRLLKTHDFKIGEIAGMLGFNDIYEFSHFFMKMAGISPRDYQISDQ